MPLNFILKNGSNDRFYVCIYMHSWITRVKKQKAENSSLSCLHSTAVILWCLPSAVPLSDIWIQPLRPLSPGSIRAGLFCPLRRRIFFVSFSVCHRTSFFSGKLIFNCFVNDEQGLQMCKVIETSRLLAFNQSPFVGATLY